MDPTEQAKVQKLMIDYAKGEGKEVGVQTEPRFCGCQEQLGNINVKLDKILSIINVLHPKPKSTFIDLDDFLLPTSPTASPPHLVFPPSDPIFDMIPPPLASTMFNDSSDTLLQPQNPTPLTVHPLPLTSTLASAISAPVTMASSTTSLMQAPPSTAPTPVNMMPVPQSKTPTHASMTSLPASTTAAPPSTITTPEFTTLSPVSILAPPITSPDPASQTPLSLATMVEAPLPTGTGPTLPSIMRTAPPPAIPTPAIIFPFTNGLPIHSTTAVFEDTFKESASMGNYAKNLVFKIFNRDELYGSNCAGVKGKRSLESDQRMQMVKDAVFKKYFVDDKKRSWAMCRKAIDSAIRHLK